MLRPATPLAILLLAAFAMLLLAVISTPIIQAIPLAAFDGVNFGVFGYCDGKTCTPIEIGYDASKIYKDAAQSATFAISTSTRTTLSAILVVHPVAAFFVLIMLIMAVVSHFHAPSHSSRFLLVLFIFGIITFLLCLLCFLIDVLLFVPHMAWGSYIVLAATILVAISGLVSCAMRRTVVSRKASKKRIAENAEMSGENYYNRNAQQDAIVAAAALQPSVPLVSGANGTGDKLPSFATYEQRKDDQSSDERIPLTATSPSQRSPNAEVATADFPPTGPVRSGSNSSAPSRDQYGYAVQTPQDAYAMRRGPSLDRLGSRGGRGPSPAGYRGRGGYRGGYGGPYGVPQNGRGGYGPPGRGAYPPGPNSRGGYGPRGGFNGGGAMGGRPSPPGYPGGDGSYDRRAPGGQNSYDSYGQGRQRLQGQSGGDYEMGPSGSSALPATAAAAGAGAAAGAFTAYNPDRESDLPRAESPPPLEGSEPPKPQPVVGQAVAMDATTGSPAHPPPAFGQFNNHLRDSDADVVGMLALQQARTSAARRHDTYMSEASKYSQDENAYVPARQGWTQAPSTRPSQVPAPLQVPGNPSERAHGPAESGTYYEDVDPRFADNVPRNQHLGANPADYEDPQQPGSRSPAISERSGFTSVSQRGVNPRWNPPPPGPRGPPNPYPQQMPRRPSNRVGVNVLNSNPDFQLPDTRGTASSPAGGRGTGHIPGSAYPGI